MAKTMAGSSFKLQVCTPKGLFLEEEVTEVTIPSSQGEIGLLPGHTEYTGLLGTGVLQFALATGGSAKRIVISGGFASFQNNVLLILSDSADSSDYIDRDTYALERSNLQKKVESEIVDSPEWTRAKAAIERIEAIDQLISH